ncbi:hypothetical protein TWF173_011108 [Orbilia oligospora]|nr:hypothetical protein TWF173_011108 [Orbilia oligospora]
MIQRDVEYVHLADAESGGRIEAPICSPVPVPVPVPILVEGSDQTCFSSSQRRRSFPVFGRRKGRGRLGGGPAAVVEGCLTARMGASAANGSWHNPNLGIVFGRGCVSFDKVFFLLRFYLFLFITKASNKPN